MSRDFVSVVVKEATTLTKSYFQFFLIYRLLLPMIVLFKPEKGKR
jgi:hypothetical protein